MLKTRLTERKSSAAQAEQKKIVPPKVFYLDHVHVIFESTKFSLKSNYDILNVKRIPEKIVNLDSRVGVARFLCKGNFLKCSRTPA